ncbi:MAG TPA: c-type cytochrome [Cyclobacteriaceae bacterium]|jgi:putative heme-binding domain-containing protein|nr:c-type cytochrome [Cytophagales bacterium]HNT50640.1 c-type cytochrome [Cyclobacteriaceae bacterium]HRE66066.1 c-type cytochrome [Cyclobacteriaceae bacterium]HRF32244.1 c-type cytochrome [Cyclobacteriaceae bacterium]
MKKFLSLLLLGVVVMSCSRQPEQIFNPKLDKLKLLPGFKAEHLYSPGDQNQGSWVAMTFDNKGRMITSDQYGAIYRLELPVIGDTTKVKVEKLIIGSDADRNADTTTLKIGMGFAQGLLYAFNSLYVMVNHNSDKNFDKNTGLYRLQDTNGDDQFDKITLLKSFEGEPGEHGPHSIILSPDKKSIYISAGNHVDVPEFDTYRLPPVWQEDNLFPQIKDPRGHANSRKAPGGWIAHIDSVGEKWELVGAGFRNEFDITFNDAGDLFTYDSDMEWDFGMPWYRPTRICHVTSGSEFGWRTGNGKWSATYPDNLPPVINIGQGSPTNFMNGYNAKFPERYRKSLFAFDWSFGIIYAVHLTPNGASYNAEAEEFLSGSPLSLTDGGIGPDGAMYFLTGGRRLESDLYRVTATENISTTALVAQTGNEANQLRKTLEQYHEQKKGAIDIAWPNLKHEDRFVRYAARIAVEHQPVGEWQERALKETDPIALTQAMIALARQGKPVVRNRMIQALVNVDFGTLTPSQQIDLVRAFEVLIFRFGNPEGEVRKQLIAYLDTRYPASSNELNRLLSKVLVHINAPGSTEKTITLLLQAKDEEQEKTVSASSDLIMRNPQYGLDIARMLSNVPPAQQTYLATVLSEATEGWTPELQETYFKWFAHAFTYKGGVSYIGFIDRARKKALAHTVSDKTEYYNKLSGADLLTQSGNDLDDKPQPKGPGRRRSPEEATAMVEELSNRNFEQGKNMYEATLCSSCHSMRGEGGAVGPDLTQIGTRFSAKDILEHTLDPNKEISDQYAATVFTMKDGSSIVGRLINEEDGKYFVSQNPFMPQSLREVAKADVVSTKRSTVSIMLPWLLSGLNDEEIKDIVAYLVAGGNPDHEVFKQK